MPGASAPRLFARPLLGGPCPAGLHPLCGPQWPRQMARRGQQPLQADRSSCRAPAGLWAGHQGTGPACPLAPALTADCPLVRGWGTGVPRAGASPRGAGGTTRRFSGHSTSVRHGDEMRVRPGRETPGTTLARCQQTSITPSRGPPWSPWAVLASSQPSITLPVAPADTHVPASPACFPVDKRSCGWHTQEQVGRGTPGHKPDGL